VQDTCPAYSTGRRLHGIGKAPDGAVELSVAQRCRALAFRDRQPFSIGAVTVRNGKIVELDLLGDPKRLRELDLTILD
jgi:hypothetical protein